MDKRCMTDMEMLLVDGEPLSPDRAPVIPQIPEVDESRPMMAVPDFPAPTYEELIALLEPRERDAARMVVDDTGIPPVPDKEYPKLKIDPPRPQEIDPRVPADEKLRYAYAARVYAVVPPKGLSKLTDLRGNLIRMFRNDWVFYNLMNQDGSENNVCSRATSLGGLPLREGLEFITVVTERDCALAEERKGSYGLEGVTRRYVRNGS